MEKALVIKLENLPPRARGLNPDDLSKVFGGGCKGPGGRCNSTNDCCIAVCQPWGRCATIGGSPF
jgi:hypothetical protein